VAEDVVRVGLIGAGRNTRERHIPGFQKIPGVEIVAVANRSRESGQRIADSFNIPNVYDNWRELLEDGDIDAVCIGTWPYMHCTLTLAALDKGKHVLCEARMAANAQEAHAMLDASMTRPHLVAQIVPSPTTFKVDGLLMQLVSEGYLGDLLAVEMQVLGTDFADTTSPLHWRQDRSLSGYNILNMGIWYEAMIRWVGPATRVMAMTKVNVPRRRDDSSNWQAVTVPDHVDILCELANGAQGHLRFSAVTGLSPGSEVWLYGSEGTIYLDQRFNVFGGKRGDVQLSEITNPPEKQHSWRVEEEFINAIRGKEPVTRTPFPIGVHYMEFTEAVTRSAQTGQAIALPL
jgi:predicted dehydrogenase